MVIYGTDERFEADPDGNLNDGQKRAARVARSVGCLVNTNQLKVIASDNDNVGLINTFSLKQLLIHEYGGNSLHQDIKFTDQTCLGFATAFLVHPRVIVSAGHATWKDPPTVPQIDFRNVEDITSFCFVLDWRMEWNGKTWVEPDKIPMRNIYEISRIIRMTPTADSQALPGTPDFLVMTLKTAVVDRDFLKFASTPPIGGTAIWSAGHPYGLPLKCGTGIMARYPQTPATHATFNCAHNLTTYGGSSGSPILDGQDQIVGIHVRGVTPTFELQGQTVVPKILRSTQTQVGLYAAAMRTDALRWLFRSDARIRLNIAFRPTLGAPCDIQIYHSTDDNEQNAGVLVGELKGVTKEAQTLYLNCTMPANLTPREFRFWNFRISNRNGGRNREIESVRIIVMNPANSDERLEMWDMSPFTVTPYKFSTAFVYRILENPLWADGTWPPNIPLPL